MRVRFTQSGGIVGNVKACELDTTALPLEDAQHLQELVDGSGLSASGTMVSRTGRDLQEYEITIEDGERKVEVVVDDATIPPAAKSLVGYLKKCARPMPLK